jgi:hypothetical protein
MGDPDNDQPQADEDWRNTHVKIVSLEEICAALNSNGTLLQLVAHVETENTKKQKGVRFVLLRLHQRQLTSTIVEHSLRGAEEYMGLWNRLQRVTGCHIGAPRKKCQEINVFVVKAIAIEL